MALEQRLLIALSGRPLKWLPLLVRFLFRDNALRLGNNFATSLISTFIDKEELTQFTQKKPDSNLYLAADFVEPLHSLLIRLNFAPVKVSFPCFSKRVILKGLPVPLLCGWPTTAR